MPITVILSLLVVFSCSKEQNKHTLVFSQESDNIEAQARDYKIAFNENQVGVQLESGEQASLQLATEAIAVHATKDELLYEKVYEHTNLKFYDKGNGNVSYDFILEPGADVENVRFQLENGENAYINEDGELAIPVEGGEVRHSKPFAYQEIGGQRIAVNSRFILRDGDLGFNLGKYDVDHTVVIDPEIYFAPAPRGMEIEEEDGSFFTSVECERGVTNTVECNHGSIYVLYLNGVYFSSQSIEWKEYTDGTAKLTGTAVNNNNNSDVMTIDATFSGKTSSPPSGSPKYHNCYSTSTSGWYYYTSLNGTITSSLNGEVMSISRNGPSFQVGYGANITSNNLGFGASGWFDISGSNTYSSGDFNLMLDENCSTSCNGVDITALKIYDQTTDAEVPGIGAITDGAQISINDLPGNYYLVAEVGGSTQSVQLVVNGDSKCENIIPYTYPGGAQDGYDWNGGVGSHTVTLKAFAQDNCVSQCDETTISFSIVNDGNCQTYEKTNNANIPDGGCNSNNNLEYIINVPDNITITDINVGLVIDHSWRNDIDVQLMSPSGTVRYLFTDVGSDDSNDIDVLLDSDASTNISHIDSYQNGVAYSGPDYEDTFTPETSNALDAFDGENAAGNWKIIICDDYNDDAGKVLKAKLEICGGSSCDLTVDAGNDVSDICEGDEVTLTASISGEGSCTTGGESDCDHTISTYGGYTSNLYAVEDCGDNSGVKLWTQGGSGTSYVVLDFGASVPSGTEICVNAKLEHCSGSGSSSSTMRVSTSNTSGTSGFSTLGDETFSSSNYQEYCFTITSDARYVRVQDQGYCSIRVDYVRYETQGSSNSNITYEWTTADGNIVGASDEMTVKVDGAGTYKVKVTDCKGCEAMDEIVVNTTNANIASVTPEDVTCEGGDGKLVVNVDGATSLPIEIYYTFEGMEVFAGTFNSGSNNEVASLASGEYTNIRIVDANGCQDTEAGPFTIGEPSGCSETLVCEDGNVVMSMVRLRKGATTMETIDLPQVVTGLIDVSALTFDEYANRVNVTQLNEQVKIQFLSQGEVVTETGFTADLPDQVVRGEVSTDFGVIDLGNLGVDQVKVVHADDPNSGFGSTDGSPNSVQGVEICVIDLPEDDDCCNPAETSLFTLAATETQDGSGTTTFEETFSIAGVSDIQLCSRFNSSGNLDQTGDYVDIFYKVDGGSFVKLANQNRDYSPCSQDTDPSKYDSNRTLSGVGSCSYDWYNYPIQEVLPVTGNMLTIKVVLNIDGSERIDMTSLTLCGKACSIQVDAGDDATVCDGETATFTAEVSDFEDCVTCPDLGSDWTLVGELDGTGYYKYNNGQKTYADARNLATSEGGSLPIVTSQEINDFLETNLAGSRIWIGFTDEDTEGTFKWEDGSPVSYTNWETGEPNNSGNEDYAEMYTVYRDGTWNDANDQRQNTVVIQVSCPPSSDLDYTWSGPGGFSASTAEITVGTAGTYMVTVEDCNGCTATDAVELEVDDTEITTNESTDKEICDGESVTFTVQTNATNPPYTDIEFIRFGSMVSDPYTATGGTSLGEFDLPAASGSITTSDFPNTDPTKNETYFVYACVKPAPADGFCKPFVKYKVVINDNPDVEVAKTDPDCDETTGTIKFTFVDHDNRTGIEFQLEQGGSVVEAFNDNGANDNAGMYSITGLAPGTYDVAARWGNNECEIDLGQVVIEPVPTVCDVPELCEEGIVVDFDTAPDGTPLVSGVTNLAALQPYKDLFGAGSGVQFSTNNPGSNPLNLYDSEDPIGLDPDLERNDAGDGFWAAGNLANQPLFNLLIINQTSDIGQPNDNAGGGMIISTANQFLDAFSFDVVDLDDTEMGDAELIFENTVTGEMATLNLDVFEDVVSNTSPFKVPGVTYVERSANRISDITAAELGISSFNKITFDLADGVTLGIGSVCFKLAELGAIGNYVWVDEDSNGLQDAGEPGIPNVKVNLFYDTDGSGGLNGVETTPIATTFTDAQGGYLFPDLPNGMYFVDVDEASIPTGMTQTTVFTNVVDGSDADTDPDDGDLGNKDHSGDGYKITLDTGEENLTADFGYNYNPTDDVDGGDDVAAIGDRVWIDSDGDGVQDPNEVGVEGVELTLTGAGDDGIFGTGDDVTATTTTDENGYYLFDGLEPGAYVTEVTDDAGATYEVLNDTDYDQTGDPDDFGEPATDPDNKLTDAVVLGPGDVFLNADYGYQPTDANDSVSAIGDYVWFDADKDGNGPSAENPEEGGGAITQGAGGGADANEYGIAGVSVALIRDENANGVWDDGEPIIATDVTDENGFYYFPDLIEDDGTGTDDYLVWVNDTDNVLDDLKPTFDKDGGDVPFETGAPLGENSDDVLGISAVTNLGTAAAPGAGRLMQDFGYAPRTNSIGDGLIGDYVWFDVDRDGMQDAEEEGVEGVVVELYDLGADDMVGGGDDVLLATAVTDENGYYYFDGLSLDDGEGDNDFAYQVIIADENFDPGKPLQGFENTSDPDSGTVSPDNEGGEVVLNAGNTQDLDQDFGYAGQNDAVAVGSIGDTVFEDKDADGVRDEGEEGIEGVTIDLYRDLNGNGELDSGEPKIATETTDANGMYLFEELPIDDQGGDNDADYIVDVTDVNGVLIGYWHSTSPNQDASTNGGDDDTAMDDTGDNSKEDAFAVSLDATIPDNRNVDFGYYKDLAAVGNYVWLDTNKNGLQDDGETGINDVEVKLTIEYPNGDMVTVVTTTENDADGNPGFYEFPNLLADEDYNMGTMGDPAVDDLPKFTISVDENQTVFTLANLSPTITDINMNGNDLEDSDDFDGVVAKPIQGEEDTAAKDPATDEGEIASYDFGVKNNLLGAIGNYVWLDENSDGFQDVGEPGIPNVKVDLKDADGNVIATTFTDSDGGYLFPDLEAGMYFVDVDESTLPDTDGNGATQDLTQTTVFTNSGDNVPSDDVDEGDFGNKDQSQGDGYKVTLDAGEENLTADFGYNYNPTDDVDDGENTAALGDRVWIDSDGDGAQDPNEIGVSGVEVTLTGAGDDGIFGTADDVTATTTTDENGYYLFDDLKPGAYMVEVTDDAGASHDILEDDDYDQTGDPDDFGMPAMNPDGKTTTPVVLGPGDVFLNADFGYQPEDDTELGSIGNTVWLDADADGNGPSDVNGDASNGAGVEDDDDEEPIAGVTVVLIKDEDGDGVWDEGEPIIATDVTDENGQYLFEDLPIEDGAGSDDYIVAVTDTDNVLAGLKGTYDDDGGMDMLGTLFPTAGDPTDPADVLGVSAVTDLNATPVTDQDFGYTPENQDDGEGLIGDYVWFDNDGDGVQDPEEEGIEGVVVELYDPGADMMPGGGDDVLLATTTTDENGYYYFGGLDVDNDKYYVKVSDDNFDPGGVLEGMENTEDPDGDDDNEGGTVTLTNADPVDLDQDFGYRAPTNADGTIGTLVWEDLNADGNRDTGEEGFEGVTVDLYRDLNSNGLIDAGEPLFATEVTDMNGDYLFENLPFGDYVVDVTDTDGVLLGYWHSLGDQDENGTDDESKTDPYGADGGITINAGAPDYVNADFGYYIKPGALGNYVWIDSNKNGLQDDGETGINDVEVTLTIEYPNGDEITIVTTTVDDASGNPGFYDFQGLLQDEDYNMGTLDDASIDGLPLFTISVDEDQPEFTEANLIPTQDDVNANMDDLADSDDFDGVVAKPTQGSTDTSAKDPSTTEEEIASYDFGVKESLPAAIGNYVWLDENSDGFQDIGEPGIPNVQVDLKDENGVVIATTYTDSKGKYLFPDLMEGTYYVDVVESTLPPSVTQTTTFTNSLDDKPFDDVDDGDFGNKNQSVSFGYRVDLDSGEENLTADFGYNYNPTDDVDGGDNTAALGDRVWIDSDGDGMQDPEEVGVSGVEVTLTGAGPDGVFGTGDDIMQTTTTDDNGYYLFDGLTPGAYTVEVTDDAGASHDILEDDDYDQTGDPDDFGEPAMNPDGKTTTPVILAPGDVFLNADFGYQPEDDTELGSIGNTVWLDADADGNGPNDINSDATNGAGAENDNDEEPIPGVSVALVKDTNGNGQWDAGEPIIATDVTDEDGQYLFEDLPITDGAGSDDYIVVITDTDNVLSDLKGTYDKDGGMDQIGSLAPVMGTPTDPTDVLGVTAVTDLGAAPVTDVDFGYTPESQDDGEGLIGDYVWFDNDGDGNQDADEPGIEGVVVELYDPGVDMMPGGGDDVLLATTTTDENGNYYFGGLDADNDKYYVKVSDDNFDPGGVLEGMENTEDPDGDDDSEGGTVTLTNADPVDLDQDFGYRAPTNADGTIGNFVWEDTNADGDFDAGEEGIEGITLDLYRDLNSNGVVDPGEPLFATETTDMNGAYLFENLPFGDYIVDVTDEAGLLNGYWHSLGDQAELGTDNESKIDPYGASGGITINAGAPDYLFADFGYYVKPAALGNFVWNDLDGDGIQDAGEPGINGVEVTLTIMYPNGVTTTVKTTTSTINGKDGSYNFGNLLLDEDYNAGTSGDPMLDDLPKFTISVDENQMPIADLNLVPTLIDETTPDATDLNDSDDPAGVVALPTQGQENTTPLADPDMEEVIASYDFGWTKFVSIGSTVFIDEDNNGFQDVGDDGIEDVKVILYQDTNGNGVIDGTEGDMPFRMTMTNADGEYFFDKLPEGKYQVVIPEENFQSGGVLNSFAQSATTTVTDPNDNTDRDDNGSQASIGQETTSPIYMLMAGMEPVDGVNATDEDPAFGGDQDGPAGSPRDKNGNMTVDFAFLNIPLPVELLAFKATPDADHIDLTWITASEIDNDYFDLERSTDGKVFKAIAQLDGQGNTLERTTYDYEDTGVQTGVLYYYRLRQVDYNGTFEYSEIVTAQINGEKEGGMELYPNPVGVGAKLNVRLYTEQATAELYIMDVEGRILRTVKRDIVKTGWNVIEIEVSDLAAGPYILADRFGEIREFVKAE